jgi:hypothetical protein
MDRLRLLVAGVLLLTALLMPAAVLAAGLAAPAEPCVPGSVWEDPSSGVKYLCVYDEVYGGPRWVLLSSGQRGASGFPFRSSTYGCIHLGVGLTGLHGSGGDAIARTYRWPCSPIRDRVTQPAGEIRSRLVLQRYGGSGWSTCRDSGYLYNTSTAFGWVAGLDMGAGADCGSGSYRAVGYGSFLQGGLWRGGMLYTPLLWLP